MADDTLNALDITPVVLAGGSGTRLWPLSRTHYPKQFLTLGGEASLLQRTARRATASCRRSPIVVCNEEHRFLTAEQIRAAGVSDARILLEPVARNTAPAIAVAAWHLVESDKNAVMVVMPADQLIADTAAFTHCLAHALEPANAGALVAFGVKPSEPATGYGYIRAEVDDSAQAFPIRAFVEKPDAETAQQYLDDGGYFWNAGVFVFRAARFLEILESLEPAMHRLTREAVQGAERDLDFVRLAATPFSACRSDSIDYAVMEKSGQQMMVPLRTKWSDVGSWDAVFESGEADSAGNVSHGDTLIEASTGCYVHSESRLVATLGLHDIAVVETDDSVLVASLDQAQHAKRIAAILNDAGRPEAKTHQRVYRPWGSYESLALGDRFQVKRIIVKPGARLSLQRHQHRSEHWIVVYGTARVTIGDNVQQLTENESTYVPLGSVHRLENPGRIPLIMIEVQSGSYLGEDDIERLEDIYGRMQLDAGGRAAAQGS